MLDVALIAFFSGLQIWVLYMGTDDILRRMVFGLSIAVYMLFQFTEFSNLMFLAQLVSLLTWSISEVLGGFDVGDALLYAGLFGFVMCILFAIAMGMNNPEADVASIQQPRVVGVRSNPTKLVAGTPQNTNQAVFEATKAMQQQLAYERLRSKQTRDVAAAQLKEAQATLAKAQSQEKASIGLKASLSEAQAKAAQDAKAPTASQK